MSPRLCNTRNSITGKEAGKTHHCGHCKKKISARCFKKLHLASCTVIRSDTGRECGERFLVRSRGGCMCEGHSYHDGANKAIQMRFREMHLGTAPWEDDIPEVDEDEAGKDESEEFEKLDTIVEEEETKNGVHLTFTEGRSPFEKWNKSGAAPVTPQYREKRSPPAKDNSERKTKKQALAVTAQDLKRKK
ncbi:hypothetical protein BU16DRAFT_591322 [Lophium mytilinum]|uniref:Uncharacterized protein n=1 Tax=Lophium mytilinum TaxID=390894 RepID=A0A6A6QQ68_9PEZI|nr:hypothetical protein BU16DRAFT_591322 [Lophium mytilinum]